MFLDKAKLLSFSFWAIPFLTVGVGSHWVTLCLEVSWYFGRSKIHVEYSNTKVLAARGIERNEFRERQYIL